MKLIGLSGRCVLLALVVAAGASCKKKESTSKETPSDEGKEATMKTTETEAATEAVTPPAEAMPAPTAKVKVSDKDELPVWVVGKGTPIVVIHPAMMRNFFKPVVDELAKKGQYQLIWYHRRGYTGAPTEPVPIAQQASDIVKILDELKISKAHLVGHSYGANIALELVLQSPDRVSSALLLEPGMAKQVESGKKVGEVLAPIMAQVEKGDMEGASTAFLGVMGLNKELLENATPGSWAHVVQDAPTWCTKEIPMLVQWEVDPAKAKAVTTPLALGHGPDKLPNIAETRQLLLKWQPKMKIYEVPGAEDHMFPVKQADKTAAVIDEWVKSQGASK